MRTVSLQEALRLALQHHQAGRLREAKTIYRQTARGDWDSVLQRVAGELRMVQG
jgi:hypothetical protein